MGVPARAIADLFARQDGLATVAQLRALGVTPGAIRVRLGSGEWQRISQSVIGSASTPWTWRRRVRAAWMDGGDDTAVSHATAARLHGFDGFDREPELHLTSFGVAHHTALPGVTVHRSRLIDSSSCIELRGLRVVTRPVALLQLGATRSRDDVAKALDGMLRDGNSPNWIRQVATSWRDRRGYGAATVQELLEQTVHRRLPRSWFQRVAKRLLQSRRIRLVDEHPVVDPADGRLLAQLDLADAHLMVGVECQSWQWHGSPSAQRRDARRKRRLRLLGWELVDVWWSDLDRLDEVVAELEFLIDRRRGHSMA